MDTIQTLLTAGASVLTFLLLIIGFFLRQHISVVKELIQSVNHLARVVAVLENNAKNTTLGCNQKHFIIDGRLTKHGDRIDDIDKEIATIREKLKHV